MHLRWFIRSAQTLISPQTKQVRITSFTVKRCAPPISATPPRRRFWNKAVIDRRLRPRCCHLGSYFKRPKSRPVRPLAWSWYYCASFKPNPRLRVHCAQLYGATWLTCKYGVIYKTGMHNLSQYRQRRTIATATGNMHKTWWRSGMQFQRCARDRQPDTLITILGRPYRGRSNETRYRREMHGSGCMVVQVAAVGPNTRTRRTTTATTIVLRVPTKAWTPTSPTTTTRPWARKPSER